MSLAPAEAVVIGGSAGAFEALSAILPALPANYALPLLIVVHLPADKKSIMRSCSDEPVGLLSAKQRTKNRSSRRQLTLRRRTTTSWSSEAKPWPCRATIRSFIRVRRSTRCSRPQPTPTVHNLSRSSSPALTVTGLMAFERCSLQAASPSCRIPLAPMRALCPKPPWQQALALNAFRWKRSPTISRR